MLCPACTEVVVYALLIVLCALYALPIVFCALYTLPVVFSPPKTDVFVYMPPVAVLPPHKLTQPAKSSTSIFAMSLPNRAIGFRVFDVTGFRVCVIDEVRILGFQLDCVLRRDGVHARLRLDLVLREGVLRTMHN